MSRILHMETPIVRDTARHIDYTVSELAYANSQLRSCVARLSWAWQGSQASRFRSELSDLIYRLEQQTARLQNLATRAYHEVDEWEDAAAHFGNGDEQIFGLTKWGDYLIRADRSFKFIKPAAQTAVASMWLATQGLKQGITYAGQVKFFGPKGFKENILEVSNNLTHITAKNLPDHMLSQGAKWSPLRFIGSALDIGSKSVQSWNRYDNSAERAGALTYDLAFVAAKTVASPYIQYTGATLAVTAVVALGGAPLAVAGAGSVAWYASGVAWDVAADGVCDWTYQVGLQDSFAKGTRTFIEKSGQLLQSGAQGVNETALWAQGKARDVSRAVDQGFSTVIGNFQNPNFGNVL